MALPFGAARGATGGDKTVKSAAGVPIPGHFTLPFKRPVPIGPTSSQGMTDYFDVRAYVTRAEILPGVQTEILGYNGTFPGPTFACAPAAGWWSDRNELPVPVVVHLHGGHTPAERRRIPHRPRAAHRRPAAGRGAGAAVPGTKRDGVISQGARDYTYPAYQQRAATLWYHDHRMDFTGPQVWRGLAGFHLVRDDEEDALPLPRGDRDIPLMIADRAFARRRLAAVPGAGPDADAHARRRGRVRARRARRRHPGQRRAVAGRWRSTAARYRLRLLNASNARGYRLQLDPPPPGGGAPASRSAATADCSAQPLGARRRRYRARPSASTSSSTSRAYRPATEVTLLNRFGDGRHRRR